MWAYTHICTQTCKQAVWLLVLIGAFIHIRERRKAPALGNSQHLCTGHLPPSSCPCWRGVVCWGALSTVQLCVGLHMTHPGSTQPFILISCKNEIDTSKPTFFPATKPNSGTSVSLWCFYHYFPHIQIWMIWEPLNSCFHKRPTIAFPGSSKSFPSAR